MKDIFGDKNELHALNTKKQKLEQVSEVETVENGVTTKKQRTEVFQAHKAAEPHFFRTYESAVSLGLLDDFTKNEAGGIRHLSKYVDFETSVIHLNASIRETEANNMNIQKKTFDNIIISLKEKDILFHLDTNVYMFNPFIFSKGAWSNILKLRNAVKITKAVNTGYKFDYSEITESYLKNKGQLEVNKNTKDNKTGSSTKKSELKTKPSLINMFKNLVSRRKEISSTEFDGDSNPNSDQADTKTH